MNYGLSGSPVTIHLTPDVGAPHRVECLAGCGLEERRLFYHSAHLSLCQSWRRERVYIAYTDCIYNPRHDSEWESLRFQEHLSTGCGLFHITMYINAPESCNFMFLFCFFIRSGLTLKNDATEIFYSHVVSPVEDTQSNASLNRARTGGRGFAAHERGERTRLDTHHTCFY